MLNQLGNSVSSELDGNPPLWVTRRRTGTKDDIYVNNAKVIATRSNLVYTNLNSRKQVRNTEILLSDKVISWSIIVGTAVVQKSYRISIGCRLILTVAASLSRVRLTSSNMFEKFKYISGLVVALTLTHLSDLK